MKDNKKTKTTRSKNYEPKVKFDGTFEQMIAMSVKNADKKVKEKKVKK
jgi:hypothetical protein